MKTIEPAQAFYGHTAWVVLHHLSGWSVVTWGYFSLIGVIVLDSITSAKEERFAGRREARRAYTEKMREIKNEDKVSCRKRFRSA